MHLLLDLLLLLLLLLHLLLLLLLDLLPDSAAPADRLQAPDETQLGLGISGNLSRHFTSITRPPSTSLHPSSQPSDLVHAVTPCTRGDERGGGVRLRSPGRVAPLLALLARGLVK